jgi:hypothetical protein
MINAASVPNAAVAEFPSLGSPTLIIAALKQFEVIAKVEHVEAAAGTACVGSPPTSRSPPPRTSRSWPHSQTGRRPCWQRRSIFEWVPQWVP